MLASNNTDDGFEEDDFFKNNLNTAEKGIKQFMIKTKQKKNMSETN